MKRLLVFIAAAAVASCAHDARKSAQAKPAEHHGERDINDWAASKGGSGYAQDAKGNWMPKDGARRSQFEAKRDSHYTNKANAMFGGNQTYKTGDFKKTNFWGNKEYIGHTQYAGNTDGSRFKQASHFADGKAREAGSLWAKGDQAYKTKGFATRSAREQNGKHLDHPSDVETDLARRNYEQPEIHDWREQRSMSVDQTKGILGR